MTVANKFIDQKKKVREETLATIDFVVKALAGDEQTVCYVFLNAGVEKKSSGFLQKLPGMIAGVAIGGALGEMVFGGSLLSNNATYAGELNILVVTQTRLLLATCKNVPFVSQDAAVTLEHLNLLKNQWKTNSVERRSWEISNSQVFLTDNRLSIVNSKNSVSLNKSELYVNNSIRYTHSLIDIYKQITQLGTMPTPSEFITKLFAGENPIRENQVVELAGDNTYISEVSQSIIIHKKRRALIKKLSIINPTLKEKIGKKLCTMAIEAYRDILLKLIIWFLLSVGLILGFILTIKQGFIGNIFFFICAIITTIRTIAYLIQLLPRLIWYRTIIKAQ